MHHPMHVLDAPEGRLPEIREFSEFYISQQDGAPAHRARETVALLTNETPDFINPTLWPPVFGQFAPGYSRGHFLPAE